MDFRRLEIFRAVARRGNLRQAAAQLGITLPAVSIQIKKLEEELGAKLFHHLPNKLVLTDQGRSFHHNLDGVFDALHRATAEISEQSEACQGNVSIALGTDISRYFAPRIARFVKENAGVNFSLVSRSSTNGLALLAEKAIDMSVGFYKSVPRGIERIPLLTTGISLVHPRGMKVNTDPEALFRQISEQRVIMLPRSTKARRMIDSALEEHDIATGRTMEIGGCQSIIDFVRLGLGIGLVHSICASVEFCDDLGHMDVSDQFGSLDVALAIRPETLLSSAHQALIDTLSGGHTSTGKPSAAGRAA
jgi:DNA-binding transcriptional LysR family regulator